MPAVLDAEFAVSSLHQRWPSPLLVLIAPVHRGMARLSGPEKYRDGIPATGRHIIAVRRKFEIVTAAKH